MSTTPILNDTTYTKYAGTDTTTTTKGKSELGKQDFLNLLVTQLKNQDPLNPMKDTEFIAQLANFSNLEQTTAINKTMQEFLTQQRYQNSAVAVGMIGKQVKAADGTSGVVSSVVMDESGVYLMAGDKKIALSDVQEIKIPKPGA